jgi:uncharacterized membrane protein YeaQ/YmgE (transglycosylase-associated protein family)
MGALTWILIGLLAGWLAARITNSPYGVIRYIAVGLAGSIFGGLLFTKLKITEIPDFWGQLITATIGAVVLLMIWHGVRGLWRAP